MQNETRLCPLPYEQALETIIKAVWTKQLRYPEKAALVVMPRDLGEVLFASPTYASLWGAPNVKIKVT